MSAERTTGKLLDCGLSRRDILIGALLAMDNAVRSLKSDDVDVIAKVVGELSAAVIDCETPIFDLAYGIPRWLVGSIEEPGHSSGLGAFIWSIYNLPGIWSNLFDKIFPDVRDLEDLHQSLSNGPFQTPRERFQMLRTQAAVAADGRIQDRPLRAGGENRERSELTALARVAASDGDPVLADLGSRLGGMDFVVVAERQGTQGWYSARR